MSARPLLIGEAPSRRGDRYHMLPLSGPPARVLCKLAGIGPEEGGSAYGQWTWALYHRFATVNVFERYADATPWSAPAARERAAAVELHPVNVLLGRKVADAFALSTLPNYRWEQIGNERGPGAWAVVIPHPSGRNRSMNTRAERARCGEALRQALDRAEAVGTVEA